MSIGTFNAHLVHDFLVTYRGTHDKIQLFCIVYDLFHLAFWTFTWLFLSVKNKWTFKIRISVSQSVSLGLELWVVFQIGEAVIRESRSLRLIHSVHLNNQPHSDEASPPQPLLIIGNGRTYTVADTLPKKAIMEVLQRSAIVKKSKSNGIFGCKKFDKKLLIRICNKTGSMTASEDLSEEIYWLRPTLDETSQSQKRSKYLKWFRKKSKQNFTEASNTSPKRTKNNLRNSVIPGIDEDDGDYATLRELPLASSMHQRTTTIEPSGSEGKVGDG